MRDSLRKRLQRSFELNADDDGKLPPGRAATVVQTLVDRNQLHDSTSSISPTTANSIYCDALHLRNQLGHIVSPELSEVIHRLVDNARFVDETVAAGQDHPIDPEVE